MQESSEPSVDMLVVLCLQKLEAAPETAKTRSDSTSMMMDESEFEEEILRLLGHNEETFSVFCSLYEDFK